MFNCLRSSKMNQMISFSLFVVKVIIFYFPNLSRSHPLRKPNFSMKNKNFFNWTMTYRKNSDIFFPFAFFKNKTIYFKPKIKNIKKKTGYIAWISNLCNTTKTKLFHNYVTSLQKYIPVDIYGVCGTHKCSYSDKNIPMDPDLETCYKILKTKYFFYLSFEEKNCVDYYTEKIYYALQPGIVPIVWDEIDYDIFPKNSVIKLKDFTGK